MSGLFLNFYQVEVSSETGRIASLDYNLYSTKEEFLALKTKFPDVTFYRSNNRLFAWKRDETALIPSEATPYEIQFDENPKVLSRIIEDGIIAFMVSQGYSVFKNMYTNSWEIISSKDVLSNSINGLTVNRVLHFSPYFFIKDEMLLLGFTLSSSLKNNFTWNRREFEENGVDIKGLKGNNHTIFANRQSIKRFLESRGAAELYDSIIQKENINSNVFKFLDKVYGWLNFHKNNIRLPAAVKIKSIIKRYLPFENELVKPEIIAKPQRYFYSNRKNSQGLKYYDQMVKAYQPYSLELYQNKQINIGIICPSEYQGETEGFIRNAEVKLKEVFHCKSINICFKTITGKDLDHYKEVLYDEGLLQCQLIFVVVNEAQKKLSPNQSPYYYCKAKLIGNGIPTQDIKIETIRQNLNNFTMGNIALNAYAKLGGTGWTIEKEDKLREELVVGIGSTISANGQFVMGIAQVFHNDGRYMAGDCCPLSSLSNYSINLENHLFNVLKPLVDQMSQAGTFRLIFHLFKSAGEKYELKALEGLKARLSSYNFEFALVHLAYGHNFRLYYNDGRNDVNQGTYLQLSKHSALLHFVSKSDLPLKIDLDKRSTFTSLFYIAKQVYWFSHLSHRSYIPSKRTVTIMYPSIMAKMTEELKQVEGWDYDRLKAVKDKLWFI